MLRKAVMILATMCVGVLVLIGLTWAVLTQPLMTTPEVVTDRIPPVDPKRLEGHVRMLSETFFPRNGLHPENLDRAAAYVSSQLQEATGQETSEQVFKVGGNSYRNVILHLGPPTEELIVVGAHYDAWDELPGADDNASGVAGLIELSRILSQSQLPMGVELVAYTLEEPPYFGTEDTGSAKHAQSLRQDGVLVRLMISLEMIGYFRDEVGSQRFPLSLLRLVYSSQGNFIAVVGKLWQGGIVREVKKTMRSASSLPVHSINAPAWVPGIDWSDHRYYWAAGYPAVMLTDTAFYRNKNYHTPLDLPSTLDYERMAMVVQGVYAVVHKFAGS